MNELQAKVNENLPEVVTYLYLHSTPTAMPRDRLILDRTQPLELASTSMKSCDVLHEEAADRAALLLVRLNHAVSEGSIELTG
jgi:hypothetical protein